jgi:hypothetical protein
MAIFKLGIVVTADDKASSKLKKLPKRFQDIAQAAGLAAAGYVALRGAQKGIEFIKLGASIQATESRLRKFAGGTAEANKMLDALNKSSMNTMTRMGAMTTASTLMSLKLATTSEEMGVAGAMLGRLARQGLGAEGAMNSLTMLLANQSKRRLDDFSLSVEEVTARQKKLEAQGLSTQEAFKTAVYDAAANKLALLGDTSDLAATKIAQTEASLQDTKNALAEMAATAASASGALDGISGWAKGVAALTNSVRENSFSLHAWSAGMKAYQASGRDGVIAAAAFTDEQIKQNKAMDTALAAQKEQGAYHDNYKKMAISAAEEAARLAQTQYRVAQSATVWQKDEDELRKTLTETERAIRGVTGATWDYGDSTDDAESGLGDLESGLVNVGAAYAAQGRRAREAATEAILAAKEQAREQARAARQFTMNAQADWSAYARDNAETAADLAADKEKIEQTHADKLAAIQKKGQATAVRIDAEAEQAKLDKLKERMKIALQQQSEFTEKTKESTRMNKDLQIASLQTEIDGKETLLANYHAGRLVNAGQNVDGLLAEEDRRYAAELEKLKESRTEQELALNQSLGRMVVEQWKAFALGTDLTQEEIDKVTLHFMEQYGLITDAGVEMAANSKRDMELFAKHGVDAAQKVIDRLNDIPRHIEITFSTREVGRSAAEAEHGAALPGFGGDPFGMASGGISRGGRTMVGELGAEIVDLPRGARVTPASQVNDNRTYRFEQTVNTRASTHHIMNDWALAEAQMG